MVQKIKKRTRAALVVPLVLIVAGWVVWGNVSVQTSRVTVTSRDLPKAFHGAVIAHISDLHNARFGRDNEALIDIIRAEGPDMIAITGDLIDAAHTDLETAVSFVEQAVKLAPCYFVPGNHEAWIGPRYEELKASLEDAGATVLQDEAVKWSRGDAHIQLIGLDDPDLSERDGFLSERILETKLSQLDIEDGFNVLLSHRPEYFHVYQNKGIDLVLSGHAHGGQVRLPLVGGVAAPGQGLFPKYDAGAYTENGTTMVVSRGLGNSIIPVRINDRPEVVIIELERG